MPSDAEVRRERKQALRQVRAAEKALDTEIERMERRLLRLLDRRTILTIKSAEELNRFYDQLVQRINNLQQSLTDYTIIVSA